MAFKKNERPSSIKIANTEIVIGKKYSVDHKMDKTAPDGMIELGATKYPLVGVAASEKVYFDDTRNVFDTGFYTQSICNDYLLESENPDEIVRIYNTLIREPYEKQMNVSLAETNFAFWDNFSYKVQVNKTYNTNDIVDLFELFLALKQGVICNKGERNSRFQKAQYNISNPEAIKNKEDIKFDNKMKAINTFNLLLESDIEKAYTILEYLQATDPRATHIDVLRRQYLRTLEADKTGTDSVDRFLEAVEKYNQPKGQLEMQYFAMVQKLYLKKKIILVKGIFQTEDFYPLAGSLKDIARKCAIDGDKEFKDKVEELYQKHFPE